MIMIDIDMPDNCDECRFTTEYDFCKAMPDNFCGMTDNMKRPEWCPLKEQEPPPERKTAHWVFGNTMGHSWMKCSECCVSQSGHTGCWTYCPNCGAEMKGEAEVETD